jgi:hypothetical protein
LDIPTPRSLLSSVKNTLLISGKLSPSPGLCVIADISGLHRPKYQTLSMPTIEFGAGTICGNFSPFGPQPQHPLLSPPPKTIELTSRNKHCFLCNSGYKDSEAHRSSKLHRLANSNQQWAEYDSFALELSGSFLQLQVQ